MPETPSSGPSPLPDDLVARARTYFGAFLSPDAADAALDQLRRTVGDDLATPTVLRHAHDVLGERLRIASDLEVLVLREDVGIDADDAATVMGLSAAEVEELYAEALAVLEEEQGIPVRAEEPTAGREPEAAGDDEAPVQSPEEPDQAEEPAERGWGAAETEPEERHESIRVISSAESRESSSAAEVGTAAQAEERSGERRRRFTALIATVVLLAALAVALQALGGGRQEQQAGGTPEATEAPTTSASGGPTPSAPAGAGTASAAPSPTGCQEAVCVGDHRLVSEVTGATPGPARDRFTTDDDVRLWMSYELGSDEPVRVSVVWRRDGDVLYELRVRLPRAEQTTQVILDKREQHAGDYEVDVTLGDQSLFTESFTVASAG